MNGDVSIWKAFALALMAVVLTNGMTLYVLGVQDFVKRDEVVNMINTTGPYTLDRGLFLQMQADVADIRNRLRTLELSLAAQSRTN